MKSRSSSPQSSPQAVRRYRVEGGSTAAATGPTATLRKSSLRIEELPKVNMNGWSPTTTSSPVPAISPNAGLLSPISNGARKLSSEHAATLRLEQIPNGLSSSPGAIATPDGSPGWSSAIGHATTTGKSGRVIERLMNENDRLKRDLNAQVIRCQELEKSLQTYKPQIEALRQENDNLSHARGVDSSLIARRDRKLDELKAELAGERERRQRAEILARQREHEKDDAAESSRREMQSMTESTKHATLHAEILETSHKQLAAEYRARAEAFRKDFATVVHAREQDRQQLAKLDVVADQMRQELERSKKLNAEIVEVWERLRGEHDARFEMIEHEAVREGERTKQLNGEMEKAVNEMRWLMGVKRNVRGPQN